MDFFKHLLSINCVFWHILRHSSESRLGPYVSLYFKFIHTPWRLIVESVIYSCGDCWMNTIQFHCSSSPFSFIVQAHHSVSPFNTLQFVRSKPYTLNSHKSSIFSPLSLSMSILCKSIPRHLVLQHKHRKMPH